MMRTIAAAVLMSILLPLSNANADDTINTLSAAEQRGGWKLIFDGRTLDAFRNYQADQVSDGWAVTDGAIEWQRKGAGDLITRDQYKYFELQLEYRISEAGNSGLMFHVTEEERRPWQTGPEVQIQDNKSGHDPQKAGWLYQLYQPQKPAWAIRFEKQVGFDGIETDDATRPAGEWNHLYLRISPVNCEVAINGVSYYYFKKGSDDWDRRVAASKFAKFPKFGKADKGHICLQDHGDEVAFRNIKIREFPDSGRIADPVDGSLPLEGVQAFPDITWEGYEPVDEDRGRTNRIRPIEVTHAGDGSNRLFVATQSGAIYVLPRTEDVDRAKLFLDLRKRVHDWQKDAEEGLLSLAFHPDFPRDDRLFVYYSSAAAPRTSVVSSFRVSDADANLADPDSETVVMKISQPFSNHNGGSMVFGHDGYLYIALGDGGGRNDPLKHGQNLSTWMGSVLRIDVNGKTDDANYLIPSDNPFVDRPKARPEIFAYGIRNIWRLTVDRQTGDLWAADVGQDFWEEVNILQKGGNYGWSLREASYPFNNLTAEVADPLIDPIWEYDHQVGSSITGGFVYRGSRFPELQGWYVYADFVRGRIWALQYDRERQQVIKNMAIASTGFPVIAFGEDEQGELYYTIETVKGDGIFRFRRTGS
ncbi:MAG: hypothetical protein Fues2KO_22960 [Fuerstiella sp.]